jgi:hypothetical protein
MAGNLVVALSAYALAIAKRRETVALSATPDVSVPA